MKDKKMLLTMVSILSLVAALIGGTTMAWFTDAAESEPASFQAGTVLIEADSSSIASQYFDSTESVFVYGATTEGDLYEIDVQNGTENRFFNNPNNYSGHYPNALAFDDFHDRLYFAQNNKELMFYDFTQNTLQKAGEFEHGGDDVFGATFGGGYLWYIPNNTALLYRVTLDDDGSIVEFDHEEMSDDENLRFGDVVIEYRDGMIYGSDLDKYFTYDIDSGEFTDLGNEAGNLQLAWGHDGNLYGHSTGSRNWYWVDSAGGSKEQLFAGENAYNDLASGHLSYWNPGDCGWADFEVENAGTKRSFVRVELTGFWQEKTAEGWEDWDPEDAGANPDVVDITLADESKEEWVHDEGYYYYLPELSPGETAELSVEVCISGPETCNLYQGKRFVVEGVFDAIQTTHGAREEHDWYAPQ